MRGSIVFVLKRMYEMHSRVDTSMTRTHLKEVLQVQTSSLQMGEALEQF